MGGCPYGCSYGHPYGCSYDVHMYAYMDVHNIDIHVADDRFGFLEEEPLLEPPHDRFAGFDPDAVVEDDPDSDCGRSGCPLVLGGSEPIFPWPLSWLCFFVSLVLVQ